MFLRRLPLLCRRLFDTGLVARVNSIPTHHCQAVQAAIIRPVWKMPMYEGKHVNTCAVHTRMRSNTQQVERCWTVFRVRYEDPRLSPGRINLLPQSA